MSALVELAMSVAWVVSCRQPCGGPGIAQGGAALEDSSRSDATAARPPPTTTDRDSVLIVISGDGETIGEAIRSAAVRLGVRAVLERGSEDLAEPAAVERSCRERAEQGAHGGVFWLREGDAAYQLFWFDRRGAQFVVREFDRTGSSSALVQDRIVNVAASAVAQTFDEPTAPALDSPKPSALPASLRPPLWWSIRYVGNTFAPEIPWQNGVGLAFEWWAPSNAALGVQVDATIPMPLNAEDVEVQLFRFPLAVFGGFRWSVGRGWYLGLIVQGAVEPVRRVVRVSDSLVAPAPSTLRWFSSVGASLDVSVQPLRRLRLFMRLGPEVVTTRARYAVSTSEGTNLLVDPDRFRFVLQLGIGVGAGGRKKH